MNKLTSKFYLVGIKGNGLCALACLLKDLGYVVIGSDVNKKFHTDEILNNKGIKVSEYNLINIKEEYLYIIGYGAINSIEAKKVMDCGYNYYMYGDFINSLHMNIIAVAGTHGKTTTSKILSILLNEKDTVQNCIWYDPI